MSGAEDVPVLLDVEQGGRVIDKLRLSVPETVAVFSAGAVHALVADGAVVATRVEYAGVRGSAEAPGFGAGGGPVEAARLRPGLWGAGVGIPRRQPRRKTAFGLLGLGVVAVVVVLCGRPAGADETTTTAAEATTTTVVEVTTTTAAVPPPLSDCFLAGQMAADTPPSDGMECAQAWSSGRQSSLLAQGEAARDDAFRRPFLLLVAAILFVAVAKLVGGWRR